MTDADLSVIYSYLTTIPPAESCNTVDDGFPVFSGTAAGSTNYVYPNTPDSQIRRRRSEQLG